jgi:hypothetical protein
MKFTIVGILLGFPIYVINMLNISINSTCELFTFANKTPTQRVY